MTSFNKPSIHLCSKYLSTHYVLEISQNSEKLGLDGTGSTDNLVPSPDTDQGHLSCALDFGEWSAVCSVLRLPCTQLYPSEDINIQLLMRTHLTS